MCHHVAPESQPHLATLRIKIPTPRQHKDEFSHGLESGASSNRKRKISIEKLVVTGSSACADDDVEALLAHTATDPCRRGL
jgi:hypothetical protein